MLHQILNIVSASLGAAAGSLDEARAFCRLLLPTAKGWDEHVLMFAQSCPSGVRAKLLVAAAKHGSAKLAKALLGRGELSKHTTFSRCCFWACGALSGSRGTLSGSRGF